MAPGPAHSKQSGTEFTLENNVIAATWKFDGDGPRLARLANKLTGQAFDQNGTELFRLGLAPPKVQEGVYVAIRLETNFVIALASHDGKDWTELATFPRANFAGQPAMVRLGKMNLRAESRSYRGEPGAPGKCSITDLNLVGPNAATFQLETNANAAETRDVPFPAGTNFVSCRIDKGTDQGMSWAPALAVVWEEGKKFLLVGVRDGKPIFNVTTAAGEQIVESKLDAYPTCDLPASAGVIVSPPRFSPLVGSSNGVRVAERFGGAALETALVFSNGLHARWRAELRDGSSYIRQTVDFSSPTAPIPFFSLEMADVQVQGAKTIGSVPGSPVAGGGMFFGVEMPGAANLIEAARLRIGLGCKLALTPTQSYTFGAVTGVAPEGQLRRAFLFYLERERARPSSPFLHYNSWYDLGFSADSENMMDAVRQFHHELVEKRSIPLRAYLVDDGWDDPDLGFWAENTNKFPGGFAALKKRMEPLDAHLGIWISPMGGYGGAEERTADAQKMGLILAGSQLDLASPAYKNWFQERCLQLMREDGVTAFKWDRAGDGVTPHFMALLDVAEHLRQANPSVFINVTVGTWPSPFWLNHVDSTWRMGSADVGWAGKGDDREKWLTFRDGYCHKLFVEKAPLYPLNSVMHHGIVHGRNFQGERVGKTGPHLKKEARSYFANGTSLQELYVTPSMMTQEAWDDIAAAAKWAQTNADVLADSHWVGGDPLKLEPYGYAAWSGRHATLMIRNPDDQPRRISIDAATAFELPRGVARIYKLSSPYPDQRIQTSRLQEAAPQTFELEPFEVLVFDAEPEPSTP